MAETRTVREPGPAARDPSKAATHPVHLACCHRVLRAQPFDAPGAFQHFRLFALVTSDRDAGSARTEANMLIAHLTFWAAALAELVPGTNATLRYTVFGFPPLAERIRDTVRPAIEPLPGHIAIEEDQDRQRGRGYNERGAIKIHFTDWTAQLTSDAKERCFTSCISTERLAARAALAPPGQ
jgi:hypothetical protein